MSKVREIQAEVDQNFEAFKAKLPELAATHGGKFALLRHREVIQIFDTAGDAAKFAEAQFDDDLYSIQQITGHVMDLGYFSHAVPIEHV